MPPGTVAHQNRVCTGRHGLCNLGQLEVHALGIDERKENPAGDPACRAGRTEDVTPFVARIAGRARTGAGPCRFPGECSLLPNARFILT
jgi:hypothetical protein